MISRRNLLHLPVALAATPVRGAAQNQSIVKAMESVRAAIPTAESDPARPVYHFRPPANWNNDPNGTIFYKGWHHLFYQHNPYGSDWGHMHWGHARSRDLVNWDHLPIALWPSIEKGETHVFSGAAILAADGRPRLFYTSIGHPAPEQWMALPLDDDLLTWEKHPRPALTLAAHNGTTISEWRDPFLFREAGQTYMVTGGNSGRPGSASVYLYRAADPELTDWNNLGPVFEYRNRAIANIECPNLFKLDGRWVLLISPHKPCEYFIGDLDLARGKFIPDTQGVLDAGAAYASNISVDTAGRTILWLWGRTATPPGKGWNSVMVMPRILSIGPDGFLRQQPAPEFASLRGPALNSSPLDLESTSSVLSTIHGDSLEIEAELTGNAAALGFELRRSASGKAGCVVSLNPRSGALSVGSAQSPLGRHDRYKLRIFLDKRVIEVYANDGIAAVFSTIDAAPEDHAIHFFARQGAARLESLQAWPIRPANFSLERFQASAAASTQTQPWSLA